ncbi:MAG: tetratricopeptide repeat protein [Cocleimonas sp.]|nr:tetratricopeptide repeat protein [Cocleimonas sp.]
MIEILFLLLPLAFYSGWRAAKKNNLKQCEKTNQLADDYVKGVNYLLSEKPDKALEVFINHPDVDEYTAETYLLLGNMFRNRGEVDRALRLHQNLMARSSLNKAQKSAVMFALGEDYSAAGMLDRAESVFQELLTTSPDNVLACAPLRQIYEQTHEWEKAILATNCLKQKKLPIIYRKLIAHYYCEMSDQEVRQGNLHQAEVYALKACKSYKESARVMLLQADLLERKKKYAKAFKLYLNALKNDSRLLVHLFTKITNVAKRVGKIKELEIVLFDLYTHDKRVLAYLLELVRLNLSSNMSIDFLVDDLKNKTLDIYSISKAIDVLQTKIALCPEEERLSLIKQALDHYLQGKAGFQCQNCGYQVQDYLWRCPACYQWDKVSHA